MRIPGANRDILLSSGVAMGLKVLSSVCMLGFNLLVVHHFQPDIAGEFFLCITLVLVSSQVARFGLDNVLVRRISVLVKQGDGAGLEALYASTLAVSLAAGIAIAALLYAGAPAFAEVVFSNPGMAPMVQIMALSIPFYTACLLHSYLNQGLKRVVQYIVGLNLAQVSIASLLLLLAVQGLGWAAEPRLLGLCYVSGCALTLAGMLATTRRRIRLRPGAARWSTARELVREANPLFITALTQLVMVWSSQFLLGVWASPADVAVFTIAQRIAMLTSFVLVAVNSVVAPRYAELYHDGKLAELESMSQLSVRLMLALSAPLLLAMLLVPSPILGLFGDTYVHGAVVLMVLALGQFINVVTGSVGYLLQMSGHYREVRNNTLIAALTAVALNCLLVPAWGSLGAAIAAATALSLVNVLGVWHVRKYLGFHTLRLA